MVARRTIFSQSQPIERKLLVKQASESSSTVAKLQHTVANLRKSAAHQMTINPTVNNAILLNNKPSSETIASSMQNGNENSYARLTNKLNCCKGCNGGSENGGDNNNNSIKYQASTTSMPKMKHDKQLPNHKASNGVANGQQPIVAHRLIHRESMDNMPRHDMGHRLSALSRRNSIETTVMPAKNATLKKNGMGSIEYSTSNSVPDIRRQSLDGNSNCTAAKYLVYANGARLSNGAVKNGSHGNGRLANGGGDKQSAPRHSFSYNANDIQSNGTLKKQHSSGEDYFDSNGRLRALEDKIRRHKLNALECAAERQQTKSKILLHELSSRKGGKHTEFIGLADGPNHTMSNFVNLADSTKSLMRTRATHKLEFTYPDYGKAVAARSKATIANSSYGVISATDLFKLRSMSEHIS